MNDVVAVVIAIALLVGNALFVGAEFALIAARRDRLEALVAQGERRASTVITAAEQLSLMLAGCQLGITICSIGLGRVGEPAVAHLIEAPLELARVPEALTHPIAFALALAIVVVLHMLLGEMVPKNIALAGPERSAMLLVPVHLAFVRLARPIIGLYNTLANLGLRAMRVEPKDELETTVSVRELSSLIGEARQEGLLDAAEHERLTRAIAATRRTVAEVMVPLAQVESVGPAGASASGGGPTIGAIEDAVTRTGYSRYPVRDAAGAYTGYLHVKDVLEAILDPEVGPDTLVGMGAVHPLPVVDVATPLDDAIASLRRLSSHLAAVVDATGHTIGIVALEDLVEELIGTVRDETHRR